jgi:hypothetical protein
MSVNFMDVVAGDVVHLGGLQVLEIQTTGGRRFRIVAGKHAGAKETRASALCDELIDTMRGVLRMRDLTIRRSMVLSRRRPNGARGRSSAWPSRSASS